MCYDCSKIKQCSCDDRKIVTKDLDKKVEVLRDGKVVSLEEVIADTTNSLEKEFECTVCKTRVKDIETHECLFDLIKMVNGFSPEKILEMANLIVSA